MTLPRLNEIEEASRRIAPCIHRTPLLVNESINRMTGARIYFKCENFQKAGAFKSRGACNAVFSMDPGHAAKGVATHSSGNHAQALSRAAALRHIKAYIVMPRTAPLVKVNAVKEYGGLITFCEPTLESRENTLKEVIRHTGASEIHPYNDLRILTGQATCAMEIYEDLKDIDIIMTPVGGGGLLSGTAAATLYRSPRTRVIAAEPRGADDAYRSFYGGRFVPSVNPQTIADGLLTSLGSLTYPIIKEHVSDILRVEEAHIILAMRIIWERMKLVVEPSAAVPLAAILENTERFRGCKTALVLSGGNADLDHLPWKQ